MKLKCKTKICISYICSSNSSSSSNRNSSRTKFSWERMVEQVLRISNSKCRTSSKIKIIQIKTSSSSSSNSNSWPTTSSSNSSSSSLATSSTRINLSNRTNKCWDSNKRTKKKPNKILSSNKIKLKPIKRI